MAGDARECLHQLLSSSPGVDRSATGRGLWHCSGNGAGVDDGIRAQLPDGKAMGYHGMVDQELDEKLKFILDDVKFRSSICMLIIYNNMK